MKIRDLIIFIIAIVAIIIFFQWRMSMMQETINSLKGEINNKIENSFKILSDSVSARSEINIVAQPDLFDKIFNTALNKQYKEIKKMIPQAIQQELKSLKLENKLTTINKSSFIVEGDSAYFLNEDGIVTKTAKVQPINADSSLLIIVPQEIELTTVQVTPDKEKPEHVKLYVTAINKTTGDTLRIDKSVSYTLEGKTKKWKFNYKPYAGVNYDLLDGGFVPIAGLNPITYNGKKIMANFAGIEIGSNFKSNNSRVEIKILQLQIK